MTKEEILKRVSVIITKQLDTPAPPEADIVNDLGADSLDTTEIEMAIESEFKTQVCLGDARTVRQIAERVWSALDEGE